MKFLIISGLSGAGKSRAADALEDLDFYCVDNLPTALLTKFAELCLAMGGRYERVALVTDVRGQESFTELFQELGKLEEMGVNYSILYMEAAEASIIQRYKESRRPHPLIDECGTIQEAVQKETELLRPVRERADHIINTTGLSLNMLQHLLRGFFAEEGKPAKLIVNVVSFGFKYGLPLDADLVFDVRFLPNPYYIEELKHKTGLDSEVEAYIFSYQQSQDYMDRLQNLIEFSLPLYSSEGKTALVIAVGCTGGRHRSVAIARALSESLERLGYAVSLYHRDMTRGDTTHG